jgi:hypothetical protein
MDDAELHGNTDAWGYQNRPPSVKCCQTLAVGGSNMRMPSPGPVQSYAQILDSVHHLERSTVPAKVMVRSFRHPSRRPHKEDMTLVGVGTAASRVTIALHRVEDALKAQWAGRGRDFVMGIGMQDKGGISNEETRVSRFGVHRGKQAISQSHMQKRRQRSTTELPHNA